MDFVTSHFRKMNLWPVEHFFQHISYLSSLLGGFAILTSKPTQKWWLICWKVFNWSEAHLSEMTCYKIHTYFKYMMIEFSIAVHSRCNFIFEGIGEGWQDGAAHSVGAQGETRRPTILGRSSCGYAALLRKQFRGSGCNNATLLCSS